MLKFLDFIFGSVGSGYLEIRSINQRTRECVSAYFKKSDWDQIGAYVKTLQEPWNHYFGRNLRTTEGGKSTDVDTVSAISFDIDPVRLDTTKPATDKEVAEAEVAADIISNNLKYSHARVMSGNGIQLVYPLNVPIDIRGRREWYSHAAKKFEEYWIPHGSKYRCDPQFDIPRVIKLPLTTSCKGIADSTHPYRQVLYSIWEPITMSYIPSESILKFASESDVATRPKVIVGTIPPRFWRILEKDKTLKLTWLGKRIDLNDDSGSGHDMALVAKVKNYGFTKEEAKAILGQSVGGKKRYTDEYADLTIGKVYNGD